MDLIIVESPSKAKTISKYLKGKYKVDASGGHVRDLPEKRLGVDIEHNFEPTYIVTPEKKAVIKRLTDEAAKAANITLIEVRMGYSIGGKGFVTLTGDVGAVRAAVAAAKEGKDLYVGSTVIPRPAPQVFQSLL